jgi:hypothetical protein
MPNPDTITVIESAPIDSIVVSPEPTIDSIDVNTVQEVSNINVGYDNYVETVLVEDDPATLDVNLSVSDTTAPVQSVNGKIGHVVIDYPDISDTPVNHVRYVHTQASIPTIETSGPWEGYYIWTINHNLNFYPSVTVFDSGDNLIEAYIDYTNINTAIIVMNSAISGTAYLS